MENAFRILKSSYFYEKFPNREHCVRMCVLRLSNVRAILNT